MKLQTFAALVMIGLPSLLAQDPSRGEYRIPIKKLDVLKYTPLSQISIAPDGTRIAVDNQGYIYNGSGAAWQKLPGNLNQVSAGSRNEVWGVNFDHAVYRWSASARTWERISGPGTLQQVAVARGGGLVVGIEWNAPKRVVRWDAATRTWVGLEGAPAIVELALGSPNHVFGITAAGERAYFSRTERSESNVVYADYEVSWPQVGSTPRNRAITLSPGIGFCPLRSARHSFARHRTAATMLAHTASR